MDKDQMKGEGKKAGGKIEEMAGKATNNEEMKGRGKARHAEGTVQKAAGNVKDKAKDIADKVRGK